MGARKSDLTIARGSHNRNGDYVKFLENRFPPAGNEDTDAPRGEELRGVNTTTLRARTVRACPAIYTWKVKVLLAHRFYSPMASQKANL